MSKHLGAYSSLHGPAGKHLTDYTEENIPLLWNHVPERITSVANTGTIFTGVIVGYEPGTYTVPPDKTFYFSPHVISNDSPSLSLNGTPALPIRAEGGGVLGAGTFVPGTTYALRSLGATPGASPAIVYHLIASGGGGGGGGGDTRVIYDPSTTTTTVYGGDPPSTPLLLMEETGTAINIGHPTGFDEANPVFKITQEGRGETTTRTLLITDTDDPGDFGQRTAFIRTRAHFGQRVTNSWHQQYGPHPTTGASYNVGRKTISPLHISGGPNFIMDYETNSGGYQTGKKYHFLFESPSGTSPTININGWATIPLLRASGAVPATNFWPAGTEVTFVFSGTDMRADPNSNSDRPEGREDDRSILGPFTARTGLEASLLVAEPGVINRGTVARTVHITRHGEALERPVRWDNPLGFTVFGGWASYESGQDQFNEHNNFGYPFQLTVDSIGGPLTFEHGGHAWLTEFAPGPENPVRTFGIGQVTICAPDLNRGVEALYIGRTGTMDHGISFAYDHTTELFEFRTFQRGAIPISIAGGDNGGAGRHDSGGWMRIETTVPHGLSEIDLVHITNTTGNAADGVWTTKRVSDIRFLCCGCPAGVMPAGGSMRRAARQSLLSFDVSSRQIRIALPTSGAGLPAGTLWNDSGTVKIAP